MKIRAAAEDEQKRSHTPELMLHTACKKCFYSKLKEILQDPNTVVAIAYSKSGIAKNIYCSGILLMTDLVLYFWCHSSQIKM
jgi:hypothetical protein